MQRPTRAGEARRAALVDTIRARCPDCASHPKPRAYGRDASNLTSKPWVRVGATGAKTFIPGKRVAGSSAPVELHHHRRHEPATPRLAPVPPAFRARRPIRCNLLAFVQPAAFWQRTASWMGFAGGHTRTISVLMIAHAISAPGAERWSACGFERPQDEPRFFEFAGGDGFYRPGVRRLRRPARDGVLIQSDGRHRLYPSSRDIAQALLLVRTRTLNLRGSP